MSASLRSTPPPNWLLPDSPEGAKERLQQELGIGSLLAQALVARGLSDPAEAEKFLRADLEDLHDPRLLPDFDAAAKEILAAIERKEQIYVHGDYDVDGVSSSAIFARFLRALGGKVDVRVPHRTKDGYGVHMRAVEYAKQIGTKLFLTCDTGVTAIEQVEAAKEAGMRVVLTDHHEPGETLPAAHAVVNPHRHDSQYPFSDLCGAGVVFKLCAGLTQEMGHPLNGFYRGFLDLVTVGTVADVMPLIGENRILVRNGLPVLRQTQKKGLLELFKHCRFGADGRIRAREVAFQIGPRLNAVGRMDDAAYALDLLLTQDSDEATRLAQTLEDHNKERRDLQDQAVKATIEMVKATGRDQDPVILVGEEGWHHGLIGLIAGKLTEQFNRPAFVVSLDPETGTAKGSARSVPGFHIKEALNFVEEVAVGGGHELAGGFSMSPEDLERLRALLLNFSANVGFTPGPKMHRADGLAGPADCTIQDILELERLEPTGNANPGPVFAALDLQVRDTKLLGSSGEHRRFDLEHESGRITAKAWRAPQAWHEIAIGSRVHALFEPEINTYNGRSSAEWKLNDVVEVSG